MNTDREKNARTSARPAPHLTVDEVRELLERAEPLTFIDSRNPIAWGSSKVKLPGAIRVPVDEVERHLASLPSNTRLVVYCTCPGDASSARVARYLAKHGYLASYLQGGLDAWLRSGGPMDKR